MTPWMPGVLTLIAAGTVACSSIGGPGFFSDRTGQTTGNCDARVMTVETARGNLEIERGESAGAPINQNYFAWYCGELREDNLRRTSCPEETDYVEVSRNYVGQEFLAACYQR